MWAFVPASTMHSWVMGCSLSCPYRLQKRLLVFALLNAVAVAVLVAIGVGTLMSFPLPLP